LPDPLPQPLDDDWLDLCKNIEISPEEWQHAYPISHQLSHHQRPKGHFGDLKAIGAGQSKSIFQGLDPINRRVVAIALLKKNDDPDAIEDFFAEARLTAQLQHPGILTVYDMGYLDGQAYFSMEKLDGLWLDEWIQQQGEGRDGVHLQERLAIMVKICEAMSYGHQRGVLHLDLKPEHIHIGKFGEVKICDWGLAKCTLDMDEIWSSPNLKIHTLQGQIRGTPAFMSPEQVEGHALQSEKSDIYALGALLYYLLKAQPIIMAKSIDDIFEQTLGGQAQSHVLQDPELRQELKSCAAKALARKPKHRYERTEDFQADLIRCIQGFAPLAQNASLKTQFVLWWKRHLWSASLATALLLISISFGVHHHLQLEEREALSRAAQMRTEKLLTEIRRGQIQKEELLKQGKELLKQDTKYFHYHDPHEQLKKLQKGQRIFAEVEKPLSLNIHVAQLYIITQQYGKAQQHLQGMQRAPETPDSLVRWLNLSTMGEKLSHSGSISDAHLAELIATYLRVPHWDCAQAMAKEQLSKPWNGQDLEGRLKLVMLLLNYGNNIWHKQDLIPIALQQGVLNLSHRPYQRLRLRGGYGHSILKGLNFHTLNLSHTAFFEYHQLKDLQFKTLILTGCRPNSIDDNRSNLLKRLGIQTIVCDTETFSLQEIELLQKKFVIQMKGL
jgi:serine/threonine-protein kinase